MIHGYKILRHTCAHTCLAFIKCNWPVRAFMHQVYINVFISTNMEKFFEITSTLIPQGVKISKLCVLYSTLEVLKKKDTQRDYYNVV